MFKKRKAKKGDRTHQFDPLRGFKRRIGRFISLSSFLLWKAGTVHKEQLIRINGNDMDRRYLKDFILPFGNRLHETKTKKHSFYAFITT